ncbi:MAG: MiaB/RimO family radical SAM methylthiotransferase [Actinobacteria bacterium]|nr:MiaB/RimO family radical SAM methylthiotransferase [Actinomycetota bacterium]MBU1943555.1 MiaB/RimO family radical SAM methylthiotransferase [Actinomycetota bacterium]MBU2687564.1 MiaB/RimO family radical SAM methylthiotransferase [Actinomycetota bacterium]
MSEADTYRVTTLGCRVNRADSLAIERQLAGAGYRRAAPGEVPSVWVVNTCAVTGEGMRKSRKAVRRCAASGARVFVTGCGVDFDAEAFGVEGVEALTGNAGKAGIGGSVAPPRHDAPGVAWAPEDLTRVPVKVQEGCERRCSYCIVPHVRPDPYSRSMREVLSEVRSLKGSGVGEVILCGIDLGSYRDPDTGADLAALAERVLEDAAPAWVRLSSIELTDVSDELVELIAGEQGLCPHLHLPLQSGDEVVLRDMARSYRPDWFLERLSAVRERVPGISITTDVMVGFPTEGDEEFENTTRLLEAMRVSRVHVFKYSPRRGTAAHPMGDPVDPAVKRSRARVVREIAARSALRFQEGLVGRIIPVLVEGEMPGEPGSLFTRTRWFTGMVIPTGRQRTGEILEGVADAVEGGLLRGEAVVQPRRRKVG